MDFVSLRSYLEGGRRSEERTDATTLSTCSDDPTTAVVPSVMCSFEDAEQFCHVFDSIQSFPGEPAVQTISQHPPVAQESLKIVSTLDDKEDLPKVEPKAPRTRSAGEVKQLRPSVMYADPTFPTKESTKHILEPKRHCQLWGHGKVPTFVALLLAWAGCFCAVACRSSTDFALLREPFYIAPMYEPLTKVGMIRMKLCFNETIVPQMEGCEVIRLSPPEVEDRMFNMARSLLTMATGLGCGLTLILTTSVLWESINLRPLGFAFVMTYILQSFSLFFFGSRLCSEHRCKLGPGSILCIVTSLLWIGVSFAVFKMDVFKFKAQRQRRREARRKRRQERREERERKAREEELAQLQTVGSTDTDDSAFHPDAESPFDMLDEETVATTEAVNGSPKRSK